MTANGWIYYKPKDIWHFFAGGISLCKRAAIVSTGVLQTGTDDNPDNCHVCKEKLEAIRAIQKMVKTN